MSVHIKPEYLKDRVRFEYEIKQCDGVLDENGWIEFSYSHIENLPTLPERIPGIKKFHIPGTERIVAFVIDRIRETSFGYMYSLRGPYATTVKTEE